MIYYHFNQTAFPILQTQEGQTSVEQDFVKSLLNTRNFEKSDRLLGFSKGRGITWFLNTRPELGVNSVLRHYLRGGLFGKLIKQHYFFNGLARTRAMQEFTLLNQMVGWNLPVPRPIAVKIERRFCFYQADILLELIEKTQDLSKFLQKQPLATTQYQQIGTLIRRLHDHQIHHSDLNIHNILLDAEGKFWLIDFDKCGIAKGENWKADNLARLHRSFLKEQKRLNIHFQEADWQALLAGYHEQS